MSAKLYITQEPPNTTHTETHEVGRYWIFDDPDKLESSSVASMAITIRVVRDPAKCKPEHDAAIMEVVEAIRKAYKLSTQEAQ